MTTSTVTRTDFLKTLSGGQLDLGNLSDPMKAALADANVSTADLAKLADASGRVSASRLFGFIDGFDRNGSSTSFAATADDGTGTPAPTTSGKLYDALKAEVSANRAVANGGVKSFSAHARGHGVLDTNHLSAKLQAELDSGRSGVTRADLQAIAGSDGQIKGKEWDALHALADRADGASDGIASSKLKNADGSVSDSNAAGLLQAIDAEVAANRALPRYAQPGTKAAPAQSRLTTADARVVPAADRKPEVDLGVSGVNQFSLYPDDPEKGGKACYEAAVKQCTDYNRTTHGKAAPKLNGNDQAIQVAYAEEKSGRVAVDPTQAKIAREYIDRALDAGHPVLVGVSYSDDSYNHDKMTDHFVSIDKRGYDDAGRLFYEFKDPGAGGRSGRFYVDDATGKLFREGDRKTGYVESADYELTQVRTYQGL